VESTSLPAAAQSVAQHSPSNQVVSVSYRVLVSVQDGLHRGAAFIAGSSESVYLGSSPECDLVLMDDGVHEKTLCLYEQDGSLAVNVLSPDVWLAGQELPLGVKVFTEPMARLQVGGAALRVELLRRTHREPDGVSGAQEQAAVPTAMPRRRHWAAFTLAGLMVATALAVVGGAVNASARREAQQEARTLSSVVESFNALGAEMTLSGEPASPPQLRGLVVDAPMKERLESEIRSAGIRVDIQLHDVRQMAESLTRLASLADHPCEAKHLGGGRFECDAGVAEPRTVAQLAALAGQVPGVVALQVRARSPERSPEPVPAVVAVTPEPVVPAAVVAPVVTRPKLPVIRHVAVGERESFAYDGNGRRLRVGDVVDDAKVVKIRFEGVEFVRDKQRYQVGVTPMLTSASGGITN
jgi:hypothetical protein